MWGEKTAFVFLETIRRHCCFLIFPHGSLETQKSYGGVSEWPMEHAWKACKHDKCFVGSNPTSSAFKLKPLRSTS